MREYGRIYVSTDDDFPISVNRIKETEEYELSMFCDNERDEDMQEIINRSKRKNRYTVFLMVFMIMCLSLCREVRADTDECRNGTNYIFCGNVTGVLWNIFNNMTVLKQYDSNLCTVLYDGVRMERVQWSEDMIKSFYSRFLVGTWEVKEYVDSAVPSTGGECEDEAVYEAYVRESEAYIGRQYVLEKENIYERAPGKFVFHTYDDLFATVRQPATLGITPPYIGAMISLDEWKEDMHWNYIFIDSTGKAYLEIKGYCLLAERIEDSMPDGELYRWEDWADEDQIRYP